MAPDVQRLRAEWFGNPRGDILAGLVVALALIPEAIAFSIIAGVDPKVGLYASFSIAVIVGIRRRSARHDFGRDRRRWRWSWSRWCRDHGLQYLFAATILTGILQIVAGFSASAP